MTAPYRAREGVSSLNLLPALYGVGGLFGGVFSAPVVCSDRANHLAQKSARTLAMGIRGLIQAASCIGRSTRPVSQSARHCGMGDSFAYQLQSFGFVVLHGSAPFHRGLQ